jgi:hypothetical protein
MNASTSTSTSTSAGLAPYTASVNPPRRAKRARTSLVDDDTDEENAAPAPGVRPILPKPGAAGARTPSSSPRAPGPLSRAARESLRKQNHSRIEKARRTKINDALAELRVLVPDDGADEDDEDGDDEFGARAGRRAGKPKEFKLEVLVRTVGYLKTLIHRVDALEEAAAAGPSSVPAACARCGDPPSSSKRRRISPSPPRENDSDMDDDDEPAFRLPTRVSKSSTPATSRHQSITPAASVAPSPRLPPISAWLPFLPYAEPSALPPPYPSPPPSDPLPPPALALPPARDADAASLLLRLRAPGAAHHAQTPASLLGLGR